jgi:hypothetical protein
MVGADSHSLLAGHHNLRACCHSSRGGGEGMGQDDRCGFPQLACGFPQLARRERGQDGRCGFPQLACGSPQLACGSLKLAWRRRRRKEEEEEKEE